jgi:hypothetical protein
MPTSTTKDTVHIFINSGKVENGKYSSAYMTFADGKSEINSLKMAAGTKQTPHTGRVYGLSRVLNTLPKHYQTRDIVIYLPSTNPDQDFIRQYKNIDSLKAHTKRTSHPAKTVAYRSFIEALNIDKDGVSAFTNLTLKSCPADKKNILSALQKLASTKATTDKLCRQTTPSIPLTPIKPKEEKKEKPKSTRSKSKVRGHETLTPKTKPDRTSVPTKQKPKSKPKPRRARAKDHYDIAVKVSYLLKRNGVISTRTNISTEAKNKNNKDKIQTNSEEFKVEYSEKLAALKATLMGLKQARRTNSTFTLTTPSKFFNDLYQQAEQDYLQGQASLNKLVSDHKKALKTKKRLKAKKDAGEEYSKINYQKINKKVRELRALKADAKRSISMVMQDLLDDDIENLHIDETEKEQALDVLSKIQTVLSKTNKAFNIKLDESLVRRPGKTAPKVQDDFKRSTTSHTLCVSFQFVAKNGSSTIYAACQKTWADSESGKHKTDTAKKSTNIPSKTRPHGIMMEKIKLIQSFLDANRAKTNCPITIQTNDSQFKKFIKDHPIDDIHIPELSDAFHFVEIHIIESQDTAKKLEKELKHFSRTPS